MTLSHYDARENRYHTILKLLKRLEAFAEQEKLGVIIFGATPAEDTGNTIAVLNDPHTTPVRPGARSTENITFFRSYDRLYLIGNVRGRPAVAFKDKRIYRGHAFEEARFEIPGTITHGPTFVEIVMQTVKTCGVAWLRHQDGHLGPCESCPRQLLCLSDPDRKER